MHIYYLVKILFYLIFLSYYFIMSSNFDNLSGNSNYTPNSLLYHPASANNKGDVNVNQFAYYNAKLYQSTDPSSNGVITDVQKHKIKFDAVKYLFQSENTFTATTDTKYSVSNTPIEPTASRMKHVQINQNQFNSEEMVITTEYVAQSGSNQVDTRSANIGSTVPVAKNIHNSNNTNEDPVSSNPLYDSSFKFVVANNSDSVRTLDYYQSNNSGNDYTVSVASTANAADKNKLKACMSPLNISNMSSTDGSYIQESDVNADITLVKNNTNYLLRNTTTKKITKETYGGSDSKVGYANDTEYNFDLAVNDYSKLATASYKLQFLSGSGVAVTYSDQSNSGVDPNGTTLLNDLPVGIRNTSTTTNSTTPYTTTPLLYTVNANDLSTVYFTDNGANTAIGKDFKTTVTVTPADSATGGYQGRSDSTGVFTTNNDSLVNNDLYMQTIWSTVPVSSYSGILDNSYTGADFSINKTVGWSFRNHESASQKINWYFYDDANRNSYSSNANPELTVGDLRSLYLLLNQKSTNTNAKVPFIAVYTKPRGDGNDATSSYRSKLYYGANTVGPVTGNIFCYTDSTDPTNLYADITGSNRVRIFYDPDKSEGPGIDVSEIIDKIAVCTSSTEAMDNYNFDLQLFELVKSDNNASYSFACKVQHKLCIDNGNLVASPSGATITVGTEAEHLEQYAATHNGSVEITYKSPDYRTNIIYATGFTSNPNIYYSTNEVGYKTSIGVLDNTHLTTEDIIYGALTYLPSANQLVDSNLVLGTNGDSVLVKRAFDSVNAGVNTSITPSDVTFTQVVSNADLGLTNTNVRMYDIVLNMNLVQEGVVVSSNDTYVDSNAYPYFEKSIVNATDLDLNLTAKDARIVFQQKEISDLPSFEDNAWSYDNIDTANPYLFTAFPSNLLGYRTVNIGNLGDWMVDDASKGSNANLTFTYSLIASQSAFNNTVTSQNDFYNQHIHLLVTCPTISSSERVDLVLPSVGTSGVKTFNNVSAKITIGYFSNLIVKIPTFSVKLVNSQSDSSKKVIVFCDPDGNEVTAPSTTITFNYYQFFTMKAKLQKQLNTDDSWVDTTISSNSEGYINQNNFHLDVTYNVPSIILVDDFGTPGQVNININLDIGSGSNALPSFSYSPVSGTLPPVYYKIDLQVSNNGSGISVSGVELSSQSELSGLEVFSYDQYGLPTGTVLSGLTVSVDGTPGANVITVRDNGTVIFTISSAKNLYQQFRIVSNIFPLFEVLERTLESVTTAYVFGHPSGDNYITRTTYGVQINYNANTQRDDNISFSLDSDIVKVELFNIDGSTPSVNNYSSANNLSTANGGLQSTNDYSRSVTFQRYRNNLGSLLLDGSSQRTNNDVVTITLVRTASQSAFFVIKDNKKYKYVVDSSVNPIYLNETNSNVHVGSTNALNYVTSVDLGNIGLKFISQLSMLSGAPNDRQFNLDVNADTYSVVFTKSTTPLDRSVFIDTTGSMLNFVMNDLPSVYDIVARRVYSYNADNFVYSFEVLESSIKIYRKMDNNTNTYNIGKLLTTDANTGWTLLISPADTSFNVLDTNNNKIKTGVVVDGIEIWKNENFQPLADGTVCYFQTAVPQVHLVIPRIANISTLPYNVDSAANGGSNNKYDRYIEASPSLVSNDNQYTINLDNSITVVYTQPTKSIEDFINSPSSTKHILYPLPNNVTISMHAGFNATTSVMKYLTNSGEKASSYGSPQFMMGIDATSYPTSSNPTSIYNDTFLQILFHNNASTGKDKCVTKINYVQYNDNTNIYTSTLPYMNIHLVIDNPFVAPGTYVLNLDVAEGYRHHLYGYNLVYDNTKSVGSRLIAVVDRYTTITYSVQAGGAPWSAVGSNGSSGAGILDPATLNTVPKRISFQGDSHDTLSMTVPGIDASFNLSTSESSPIALTVGNMVGRFNNWLKTVDPETSHSSWVADLSYNSGTQIEFYMSALSNYGNQLISNVLYSSSPAKPVSLFSIYQPDIMRFVSNDGSPVFRIRANGVIQSVGLTSRSLVLFSGDPQNTDTSSYESETTSYNVLDFNV